CDELYELSRNQHSTGEALQADAFPSYFAALAENDVIAAHDARQDTRTWEFSQPYLVPLGITSMLDAPVFIDGVLEGVLCLEHVGRARQWTHGEQSFASAVSNLISLMSVQDARAQSESRLRA